VHEHYLELPSIGDFADRYAHPAAMDQVLPPALLDELRDKGFVVIDNALGLFIDAVAGCTASSLVLTDAAGGIVPTAALAGAESPQRLLDEFDALVKTGLLSKNGQGDAIRQDLVGWLDHNMGGDDRGCADEPSGGSNDGFGDSGGVRPGGGGASRTLKSAGDLLRAVAAHLNGHGVHGLASEDLTGHPGRVSGRGGEGERGGSGGIGGSDAFECGGEGAPEKDAPDKGQARASGPLFPGTFPKKSVPSASRIPSRLAQWGACRMSSSFANVLIS
jgi:hypothetical protein